jgi:dephospho-CoA kinase
MMRVTIVTGYPGAGKSTVCDGLGRTAGIPVFNLGDIVWTAVQQLGLSPRSRRHAGELFVAHFSEEELGRLAVKASQQHHHAILDGLRLPGTLRCLQAAWEQVRLVGVVAPEDVRLQRLLRQGETIAPSALDSCIGDVMREVEVIVDNAAQVDSPTIEPGPEALAFADKVLESALVQGGSIIPPWATRTGVPGRHE